MLVAIVISPCNGVYNAKFYYTLKDSDIQDYKYPESIIPCTSYKHACEVVDAFNKRRDI